MKAVLLTRPASEAGGVGSLKGVLVASAIEPQWALMHGLFPLMLAINMSGRLGALWLFFQKKSFFRNIIVNIFIL